MKLLMLRVAGSAILFTMGFAIAPAWPRAALLSQVPIDGDTIEFIIGLGVIVGGAVWSIANLRKDLSEKIEGLAEKIDDRFDAQHERISTINTTIALIEQRAEQQRLAIETIAAAMTQTKGRVALTESMINQLENWITTRGGDFQRRSYGTHRND